MGLVPALVVSLAIAVIPGGLLLRRLWPGAPPLLSLAVGAGLGTGLAGAVYVIALSITDSTTASFGATEFILIAAAIGLARLKNLSSDDAPEGRTDTAGRPFLLAAGLLAILCFVFLSASSTYADESRDTGWHMKARFIYRSEKQPLERVFDPSVADSDEQALLVPAMVVRGWLYGTGESNIVPIALSGLFALSTVLTLTGTLRTLGAGRQASLAGCILLGTPVFLRSSVFAPTEIAFGFFITAAGAILCAQDMHRDQKGNLPLLSGIAAGLAAATRSEGLLFVIALCFSRLLIPASKTSGRDRRRHVVWIAAGAVPGITATLLLRYIAPGLGAGASLTAGPAAERLLSLDFQLNILGGIPWQIVTFGAVGLVPLVALHLITSRRHLPQETTLSLLRVGLAVGSLFVCDYIYRLAGPYSLARDLSPNFTGLLLAAWPATLLLYSICVSTPPAVEESIETKRMGRTALIVGMVLLFAFGLEDGRQRWNRPKLTVSQSEVTAGTDSYVLKIEGMEGALAFVRYTLDEGPVLEFPARLDAAGEIRFEVAATTPKGRYHFIEFREDGTEVWVPADTYITVK